MEHKDGGPAFPARVSVNRDTRELQPHQFGNDDFCEMGMSLRDYFAAKAMQAMVASDSYESGDWGQEDIAEQSYQMADAMLKARAKEPA